MDIKSINFEFLRLHNSVLVDLAALAEANLFFDPGSTLTRLRGFAEEFTKVIYKEEALPRLPQATFYELIKDPVFDSCVNKSLIHQINYLRIQGNDTAHGAKGSSQQAKAALKVAHQLAIYLAIKYYQQPKNSITPFIELKDPRQELQTLKTNYEKELQQKQEELDQLLETLDKARIKQIEKSPAPNKEQRAKRKQASQQVADSLQWNEARTRALLIDTMLCQAGWDVNNKQQVALEFEVDFPDNKTGKGFVDYVLWADNGQPLAVVEAKRSSNTSLQAGREQARLYADAFERMGYQRPVIFYTNGYETFIWDDKQYNTYRPIYGFYAKNSLDFLIYQRQYRQTNLEENNPNTSIAGRPYQIEAIKVVAKRFQDQRRKALIIQATGTGKTRVAIALSDLLKTTGWAKRILFLCDRKELRTQADDAFKLHLPSEPRCVIGETNKIDPDARIYIATYPSMINRFAQLDIGFFHLIIADESHRSIYNKYRDLFYYFDALQLGLTATPVKFISRNTFDMFDCPNGDPTFEYDLDAAINNDPPYLSPFKVKDLTTEFLREGIHYNDLTEEQQHQLEEELGLEEAQNTRVKGKDIGRKIFSESTDSKILENLIEHGIKDETDSLVGKTIIFAQRQDHAEHLEKVFCRLYPQYGTKVCKVIHNAIPKVDSLIKEFKKKDNEFRIAISVDMLDTGIDVPEIVNLVFAKPVKSWVKFWQMIGRGTRLCPNLFGNGKNKKEFLIFDHYSNFAYFDEEYIEPEDTGGKSLLQTLFEQRQELVKLAIRLSNTQAFDTAVELIRQDINDLPEASIAVKKHLRAIHQLQQTDQLQQMSASTQHLLTTTLAPLMSARVLRDKYASQFDKLIAALQCSYLEQSSSFNDQKIKLLAELDRLAITIQAVRQKDHLIEQIRSAEFWQTVSINSLETIRQELRGIMKYRRTITEPIAATPTTTIQDSELQEIATPVRILEKTEAMEYRRRLKNILTEMIKQSPTLQKIYQGETITETELQTLTSTILTTHPNVSLELLNQFYGRTAKQLQLTIKELVGLDPQKIEQHFTDFLHQHPQLTAKQVQFLNLLKNYLAEHGSIKIEKLYEEPFTHLSHEGIDGVFTPADADELIKVLRPYLIANQANNPTTAH